MTKRRYDVRTRQKAIMYERRKIRQKYKKTAQQQENKTERRKKALSTSFKV